LKVSQHELSGRFNVIPGIRDAIEINKKEDQRQNKLFDALEVGIRENKSAHLDLAQ